MKIKSENFTREMSCEHDNRTRNADEMNDGVGDSRFTEFCGDGGGAQCYQ